MRPDPYCSNCGYSLIGLTESSKCPECGKPLVEVLTRDPALRRSRRYTSSIVLFGLPLIQIAQGPYGNERFGKARGIIAIGDVATGWFALGGVAFGLVAIGGMSFGLVAVGGLGIGFLAVGGLALGGVAGGGGAVGVVSTGGGAVGYIASGGGAVGYYARGGGAAGKHVISAMSRDPVAVEFFDRWAWLLGDETQLGAYVPLVWMGLAGVIVAVALGLCVLIAYWATQRRQMVTR